MTAETTIWVECDYCGGSGECIDCNGEGTLNEGEGAPDCLYCDGSGECPNCDGEGGFEEEVV